MISESTDKGTLKPRLWIRVKNWWRIQRVSNYSDYTHWQKLDWCARKWGLSENWHIDDYDKIHNQKKQ